MYTLYKRIFKSTGKGFRACSANLTTAVYFEHSQEQSLTEYLCSI